MQNQIQNASLLILGRGYVGSAVAEKMPNALSTRRDTFELERRETWKEETLTLPREGKSAVDVSGCLHSGRRGVGARACSTDFFRGLKVIVYGSTSSYLVDRRTVGLLKRPLWTWNK